MAATLASVCSVPLTSVLLLFELTKDYRILLPLMVIVPQYIGFLFFFPPLFQGSLGVLTWFMLNVCQGLQRTSKSIFVPFASKEWFFQLSLLSHFYSRF